MKSDVGLANKSTHPGASRHPSGGWESRLKAGLRGKQRVKVQVESEFEDQERVWG